MLGKLNFYDIYNSENFDREPSIFICDSVIVKNIYRNFVDLFIRIINNYLIITIILY